MKKLLVLMLVAVFAACSGEKKVEKPLNSTVFVEQKLSQFFAENPDWTKDATTEAKTIDKFKRQVIKWSNEPDFLQDLPLQVKNIADSTVSDQQVKIVVFKNFIDTTRAKESLLNDIEIEIKGIFSTDQIKNIELDKKYKLKGMLYKQGKRADVSFNPRAERPSYFLGKYTFWNLEAKPL